MNRHKKRIARTQCQQRAHATLLPLDLDLPADVSMLHHCSRHVTGASQRLGYFQDSHICFPNLYLYSSFGGGTFLFCFVCLFLMVLCHHSCHRVCLYTVLLVHSVPALTREKNFLVQDGNLKALLTGRSLFRSCFCLEQPSCPHPTLQFSLTV